MTDRETATWGVAVAGALALAALQTLLSYRAGPGVGLVVPLAAAAVATICWRPILGVYVAMLAVPLELTTFQVGAAGFSPAEIFLLVTALAAAVRAVVGERSLQLRAVHPAHLCFAALVVVAALGLFYAADTYVVAKISISWLAFLLVSVVVSRADRDQLERALACLVLAGGIIGVIAVTRSGSQELTAGGQVASGRATGAFHHPNVLAFFLVLTLPVAIGLAARGSGVRRTLMIVAAVAIFAGLLLTLSRSGLIGAAASLIVLLWWPPFRRVISVSLVGVLIFASLNAGAISNNKEVSLVRERVSTVSSTETRQDNPRTKIYKATLAIIPAYPFLGVGQGNFSIVSPQYGLLDIGGLHYDHAHDILLTIAAESGLIGLALFIAFVLAVGRAAGRALSRRGPPYPVVLGLVAALVGIMVMGIFEYPPRTNVIMATMLIEAGALIGYSRAAEGPGSAAASSSGRRGVTAAGRLEPGLSG